MVASEAISSRSKEEHASVLEISDLVFAFERQGKSDPVLDGISFSVNEGEIVAIMGRSGCGKSTLLNLIAGLIIPDRGQIKFNCSATKYGADFSASRQIGYIFQEDALLPWRTIKGNLSLALEIGKVPQDSFHNGLLDFLDSFHLSESVLDLYPSQLSGGMRQRVSIIQTLLFNPRIVLLDEPFAALDFYTRLSLEGEFHNLVKSHCKTALIVTHDIEEAIAIADRVIVLNQRGAIDCDVAIRFDTLQRNPEEVRGLPEFAEYYRYIWARLKDEFARDSAKKGAGP